MRAKTEILILIRHASGVKILLKKNLEGSSVKKSNGKHISTHRTAAAAALLLCLVMLLTSVKPAAGAASALTVKKVVSVVYDDSGSMCSNSANWAYANYAMQAFCSMLNRDDELYITYMSTYYRTEHVDMSRNIQDNVDAIRVHFESSGTPMESVDQAMSSLRSVRDNDPNTKYWLVIITDGLFATYDANGRQKDLVPINELIDRLDSFTAETMPNGSRAQVSYFAIGPDAAQIPQDTGKGIYSYSAADAIDIVDVMSQIADQVSGRTRIPSDQLRFVDDTTVEFTSALPMRNFAVLVQKSGAAANEASSGGVTLNPVQSAALKYPEKSGYQTDTALLGGSFLFEGGAVNIPEGTWTIRFSEPVSPGSVVIMFEPAIEIRIRLFREDGSEVTDTKELTAGDVIDVRCRLYESGTDREIDPSLLKSDVKYSVAYYAGGIIVSESNSSLELNGAAISEADSEIRATVEIPGFLPIVQSLKFTARPSAVYTMTAEPAVISGVVRTQLSANTDGFTFTVYVDGRKMTRAELEELDVHFSVAEPYTKIVELETVLNDDGTFTCIPRSRGSGFFSRWVAALPLAGIPTGALTITGGVGEFSNLASGSMGVVREAWWVTALGLLVPLLLLAYLLGLLLRRNFRRGLKVRTIDVENDGITLSSSSPNWSRSIVLRSLSPWSFVPWLPNRKKIKNVVFRAGSSGLPEVRLNEVGEMSSKLDGTLIEDGGAVDIPSSQLDDTFVPEDRAQRNKAIKDFDVGDILFHTKDAERGRLFKFEGRN